MNDRPRFTLILTLQDGDRYEPPISWAIGIDQAVRISSRAVDEMKMGSSLGVSTIGMDEVVTLMRTKELRRKIFKEIALQLAGQMADRMEDAEGWHDPDRIEPAREQLGGRW